MGEGQINTGYLRYEWYRLQSFSNVEANQSVSFLRLAKDGFYYTGQTNIVKCFFCGYEWPDWSDGKLPDHCAERNQNIPIHSDNSLLVPSGQCLSGHTTTHFHHIIRPQNLQERSVRATDYYRQNLSEQLNTSNGHNEKPSSCESLRKKYRSNGSKQTQGQTEEHNNSNLETAVEIQGYAESTQYINNARRTCTASTTSHDIERNGISNFCATRTSTTPIGPLCSTRNKNTYVNHTVQSPEDSSERSQMSYKPCRNSANEALHLPGIKQHPRVSPVMPQLSKVVKECTGVPQVYRDRLATFQVVSLPVPAAILARNGFYYIGSIDAVKCAYCGEVWHVKNSRQTSDTVHSPDCKFHPNQQVSESCEISSQTNSMSDNDVSSLPVVKEVEKIGFQTTDIVNAYREISSDNIGK